MGHTWSLFFTCFDYNFVFTSHSAPHVAHNLPNSVCLVVTAYLLKSTNEWMSVCHFLQLLMKFLLLHSNPVLHITASIHKLKCPQAVKIIARYKSNIRETRSVPVIRINVVRNCYMDIVCHKSVLSFFFPIGLQHPITQSCCYPFFYHYAFNSLTWSVILCLYVTQKSFS